MLNAINDNNLKHTLPIKDAPKNSDLLQQEDSPVSSINISFSNKAQQLDAFEDSSLNAVLKDEFNEVFKVASDRGASFLKKLDHIFTSNGL